MASAAIEDGRQAIRPPYSRGTVAIMLGINGCSVTHYTRAVRALQRERRGTGHHNTYSVEDALRLWLVRELIAVGLGVAEINRVFDHIEEEHEHNLGWAWLRTEDARRNGAALVVIHGDLAASAVVTHEEAWLQRSDRIYSVINLGLAIAQLERLTGERYQS
jgi:DNA-binding transcriptional MerR regulator